MRKILMLLFLLPVYTGLRAQLEKRNLPINPDFLEYIKLMDLNTGPISDDGKPLGYIPPFIKIQDISNFSEETALKSTTVSLPASYDLRQLKKISSVKNQGSGISGGNCWTFACLGAIESQWLTKGLGLFDLSEQNMAACHRYVWKYGQGGNETMALAYLARLSGPVADTSDPYNTRKTSCSSDNPLLNIPVVAYSPEARWVYTRYLTKCAIMDYGAVSSNIYWESKYLNTDNNTYFYDGTKAPNHAIIIVGWDDNKVTKGGTGAWIARNSWGEAWGEKGFFYISYKDSKIISPAVYYPSRWNANSVEKVYNYSELGNVYYWGNTWDTATVLVRYYANKEQFVRKIGTFIKRTGGSVEITVYDDKTGDALSNQLSHFVSPAVHMVGFYTFDVPTLVKGDFYVKVKYTTPGNSAPIPIELPFRDAADTSKYYANPKLEPSGRQWIMKSDGTWQPLGADLKDNKFDLAVYAYAENATGPKAIMRASKEEVCPNSNIVFTDNSAGTISSYKWTFGEDATPSSATGKGPHTVTIAAGAQRGLRYATLVVTGPAGTDSIAKEYKVENRIVMNISSPAFAKVGDSVILSAIGDADSYTWSPATNLSQSTGRQVIFKPKKEGRQRFFITGIQGECTTSGIMELDVHTPPVNDNICNAIELNAGDNGPFYNTYASVQRNEPMPADTSCKSPFSWCDEGGLQNSVWFKYTIQNKDVIAIDTRDLDTQIAVYGSSSCENVKKDDLVAANDDYHDEKPNPAAVTVVNDIPGKTYWIQIDGSAGGDTGSFYINVSKGALALKKANIEEIVLNVIPNPSNGTSVLNYSSLTMGNLDIKIYDLTGKIFFNNQIRKDNYKIDIPINLSGAPKGIYFIYVRGNNSVKTAKYIVQ